MRTCTRRRAPTGGFMPKDAPPEEIAAAVPIVAGGEALLAPSVTRAVIVESPVNHFPRRLPRKAAVAELTPRKGEVLDLPARGLSNPEIYERLQASSRSARLAEPAVPCPPTC